MTKRKIDAPTNDEGIEGEIVKTKESKDLLYLDEARCTNPCIISGECKRFLQLEIDKQKQRLFCDSNRIIQCDFFQPTSTLPEYNPKIDGCPKFLQYEKSL